MVDTPRTKSYILGSLFQDGQADGSISEQDVRDFVVSGPQWDEIGGVAAPNILRGTINVVNYIKANGGATGSMSGSTGTRATNGTQFQAALTSAATNGKFFEFEPSTIEINNSAGITIAGNGGNDNLRGLTWRGTRASIIKQFASNAPILTLGDVGAGGNGLAGLNFEGAWLQYGGSQTGQTGAIACRVGGVQWSTIKKLDIGIPADTSSAPYIGFRAYSATSGQWIFNDTFEDIKVWMAQNTLMSLENLITGNSWSNIYLNNGAVGTFNALTGNFLYIEAVNGNGSDVWEQLNCEWGACNQVIRMKSPYAVKFGHLHIEGTKLTGATPSVVYSEDGSYSIDTLEMTNVIAQATTSSLLADWNGSGGDGSSNIRINNFFWKNYSLGIGTNVSQTMSMFSYQGSTLGGDQSLVKIDMGMIVDDVGDLLSHLQFDWHMPLASFKMPGRWQEYEFGTYHSTVRKAIIPVSATHTVYGQHSGATLYVPAAITTFAITLSLVMGATGNLPVDTNAVVSVLRIGGSWSGTLTVVSSGGATLTTSSLTGTQPNTRYWYRFNGTAWVTFTPVT